MRRALLNATIAVALTLVSVASAGAATLKVTTTTDELVSGDGQCSLREAIAAVDSPGTQSDCGVAGRGSNSIVLGAGRYELSIAPKNRDHNTTGDLDAVHGARLTLVGAGRLSTVIDAAGLGDRVLRVFRKATVTLSQLTISGGHPTGGVPGSTGSGDASCTTGGAGGVGGGAGGEGRGGGIYNSGTLTLERVLVTGNTAGDGGSGGSGGTQETNSGCSGGDGGAGGSGGGIYNDGKLALDATTVRANNAGAGGSGGAGGGSSVDAGGSGGSGGAGGNGGGISNRGTLSMVASTVSQNYAGTGGAGGPAGSGAVGGAQDGDGGSGGAGAGIFSKAGRLTIVNSTLVANFAGAGGAGGGSLGNGGAGGSGGAVEVNAGAGTLLNATVANNGVGAGGAGGLSGSGVGASGSGGGLSVDSTTASDAMRLQNTIVASNIGSGCASESSSTIVDGGHNLSYGDTSCPGANGNPELAPLSNYGGPTATLALGSGSAAIDQVPATGADCPATDQRGVSRPEGKGCDIGAFEFATPKIDIIAPLGRAYYGLGQRTVARFVCSEGGILSPIAACDGTVPSGDPIDTRSAGVQSFDVTAIDATGQEVSKHFHYTVLPYTNPLKAVHHLAPGRIDMGVDYGGWGKILALGAGTVIGASDTDPGWPDGGWVMYQLSAGPFAGKYVYVAENITVTVKPGQKVKAGEAIATLHPAWPHLETGWAGGAGDATLADVDGHACPCGDPGGWSTIEGRNFDGLLVVVGAPSGYLQPNPPNQRMPPGWPELHPPASKPSLPQSRSPLHEGWTTHFR